jgi:hypothetical protein
VGGQGMMVTMVEVGEEVIQMKLFSKISYFDVFRSWARELFSSWRVSKLCPCVFRVWLLSVCFLCEGWARVWARSFIWWGSTGRLEWSRNRVEWSRNGMEWWK